MTPINFCLSAAKIVFTVNKTIFLLKLYFLQTEVII